MFKHVNVKTSTGTTSREAAETDEDSISLTSTPRVTPDPDREYEVEGILAEGQDDEGQARYLIEWTGFPLVEATWEAESNLSDELKALWEETKAKHATGELEPFDVQKWYDVVRARRMRHRRRNEKRKRLGLPLTEPFTDSFTDSSEEEAAEDSDIDDFVPKPAAKERPKHARPTSAAPAVEGSRGRADTRRSEAEPAISLAGIASLPPKPTHSGLSSVPSRPTNNSGLASLPPRPTHSGHPPSLGYQGTAKGPTKQVPDRSNRNANNGRDNAELAYPLNTERKSKAGVVSAVLSRTPTLSSGNSAAIPQPQRTLTAKKGTKKPAGNIFTGGKLRKPRSNLRDAISDPTKEPRFFATHRRRRLAEKRSRDKEDLPPDISSLQLFDISKGPVAARRSSGSSIQSPSALTPQGPVTPIETNPGAGPSAMAVTNPEQAAEPARKKRKSVRFLDDDAGDDALFVQEPESMVVDSPVTGDPPQDPQGPFPRASLPSANPIAAREKPILNQNRLIPLAPGTTGTQSSRKKLILGQSSVEVIFNGLPLASPTNHAWLADFLAKETLEFRHTCFAKNVATKIGSLVHEQLASGILEPREGQGYFDQVTEYLIAGLLGFFYSQAEYNILIFPTKCDDWKSIALGQEAVSPSGVALLRYFIFSSLLDFGLMSAPLTPTATSLQAVGDSGPRPGEHGPSDRELMLKRFFGFNYSHLLPPMLKERGVHNFFLAIPPSREVTLQALCHWLRSCNPECRIFTSSRAGSWAALQAASEGVVIIHEMLAWSLRRFPNLNRCLISRKDQFWCLSEPVHGVRLYPSISTTEQPVPPGDVRLTKLFPYRSAVLLTPSFIVSEPRRAAQLLEWFAQWARTFHYRIVTPYNFHEYTRELAEEKYRARQDLLEKMSGAQLEIAAKLSGLLSEDCDDRYRVAELAGELHLLRIAKAGIYGQVEDNSPVIYADQCIDPNDEQSLVNWFGWWATLRADQFRKFLVVGSSDATKSPEYKRGECLVRIPKYSKVTLNDPDAVLEVIQETATATDDEVEGGNRVEANGQEAPVNAQPPRTLQSNVNRSEDLTSMFACLEELSSRPLKFQWILFKYPVSWLDLEMADHFNDFTLRFPRISDWFKFTFPFGLRGYNTYIGFFYTIAEDWDPDNPPSSRQPERHPWIAVYRPVNPHRKPFSRCEVIIWDPAARTRFGRNRPTEQGLLYMQRQVIEHVRDNGPQKNPGTFLDQVWLGGFHWPSECDSPSPVDVTLRFLRMLLEDIKEFLPAPEHTMEARGYKRVALDLPKNHGSRSPTGDADSSLFVDQGTSLENGSMDIDSSEAEDEGDDVRIIFHPPRGKVRPQAAVGRLRSVCRNRLYEEARLARARVVPGEPAPTHMTYTFLPTMEWYNQQKAEGRGFAHVTVDTWETIFNLLRIGKNSEKAEDTSASASDGRRASTESG